VHHYWDHILCGKTDHLLQGHEQHKLTSKKFQVLQHECHICEETQYICELIEHALHGERFEVLLEIDVPFSLCQENCRPSILLIADCNRNYVHHGRDLKKDLVGSPTPHKITKPKQKLHQQKDVHEEH